MVSDTILTTEEAVAYTKHRSDRAFYRWASLWAVRGHQSGRYSRERLDAALTAEAAGGRHEA